MPERIEPTGPIPQPIQRPQPDPNPIDQSDLTDLRQGAEQVAHESVDRIKTFREDAEQRAQREQRRADELRDREQEVQRLSQMLEAA